MEKSVEAVNQDDREKARLYRLAADRGDSSGQSNLAALYAEGRGGLAKDEREAARLYRLAADQGDAWAQVNLAGYSAMGLGGLPQDDREAARLFKLAADQENDVGQGNLGLFYEQGRGGLPQDDREAARLYRLAADQGNGWAQGNLAALYAEGRGGLPQDDREATRLYKLAADQGGAAASWSQAALASLYEQGRGGLPKDDREAARLYKLAADQGVVTAQYNLGLMYDSGRGVPQNYAAAERWYCKAAEQGYRSAKAKLENRGMQQQQQEQQRSTKAADPESQTSIFGLSFPFGRKSRFRKLLKELVMKMVAEAMDFSVEIKSQYDKKIGPGELNQMVLTIGALGFFLHALSRYSFHSDRERKAIFDETALELSRLLGKMIEAISRKVVVASEGDVLNTLNFRGAQYSEAHSLIGESTLDKSSAVWLAACAISDDVGHPDNPVLAMLIKSSLMKGAIHLNLGQRVGDMENLLPR